METYKTNMSGEIHDDGGSPVSSLNQPVLYTGTVPEKRKQLNYRLDQKMSKKLKISHTATATKLLPSSKATVTENPAVTFVDDNNDESSNDSVIIIPDTPSPIFAKAASKRSTRILATDERDRKKCKKSLVTETPSCLPLPGQSGFAEQRRKAVERKKMRDMSRINGSIFSFGGGLSAKLRKELPTKESSQTACASRRTSADECYKKYVQGCTVSDKHLSSKPVSSKIIKATFKWPSDSDSDSDESFIGVRNSSTSGCKSAYDGRRQKRPSHLPQRNMSPKSPRTEHTSEASRSSAVGYNPVHSLTEFVTASSLMNSRQSPANQRQSTAHQTQSPARQRQSRAHHIAHRSPPVRSRSSVMSPETPPGSSIVIEGDTTLTPSTRKVVESVEQLQKDEEMARKLQLEMDHEFAMSLQQSTESSVEGSTEFSSNSSEGYATPEVSHMAIPRLPINQSQPGAVPYWFSSSRAPRRGRGQAAMATDLGVFEYLAGDLLLDRFYNPGNEENTDVMEEDHIAEVVVVEGDRLEELPLEMTTRNLFEIEKTLWNLTEVLGDAKDKGLTRPQIERLPVRTYKPPGGENQGLADCNICMCDYEDGDHLKILPCFHEFHCKCIDKWIAKNATCPVCRVAVVID